MSASIKRAGNASLAAVLGSLIAAAAVAQGPAGTDMTGFTPGSAAAEAQLEAKFDADLSAADLRAWMQQMASAPNHVGSAHDKANAEWQLQKFKEWGWDASIETFSVLYPTPREVSLELIEPTTFKARLSEPAIEGDSHVN